MAIVGDRVGEGCLTRKIGRRGEDDVGPVERHRAVHGAVQIDAKEPDRIIVDVEVIRQKIGRGDRDEAVFKDIKAVGDRYRRIKKRCDVKEDRPVRLTLAVVRDRIGHGLFTGKTRIGGECDRHALVAVEGKALGFGLRRGAIHVREGDLEFAQHIERHRRLERTGDTVHCNPAGQIAAIGQHGRPRAARQGSQSRRCRD